MVGIDYEERRKQRLEENKKRMEELNLKKLSLNLKAVSTPVVSIEPLWRPRSYRRRGLDRVYASDQDRIYAIERANEVLSGLNPDFPSFVKAMLQSHVTSPFWLGLPVQFCKDYLPKREEIMMLVDEDGKETPTKYLAHKTGLSGGWRGFSLDHELADGDALVFQLIDCITFKVKCLVYIIRADGFTNGDEDEDTENGHSDSSTNPAKARFVLGERKMVGIDYEERRRQRVEENKRRMEQLNLKKLALSLKHVSTPKPKGQMKPRALRSPVDISAVRRSSRLVDKPLPSYKDEPTEPVGRPRKFGYVSKYRDLSNRVYASDEEREYAFSKAVEVEQGLEPGFPSFVKPMTQSHVTGGFWLGLPTDFCRKNLPKRDETIMLVDEDGYETPTKYLAQKTGLSAGWRGFSIDHKLVDGDALVFQLIDRTTFKVIPLFRQ
ncbi:B3 DNA binding domain [Dillenia turbinata]|uniref:B3 DNA binding domain n=1 Tax=Dillenia turbinata TaxID=194707 RepID=A0AAN8US27_9MAGN